MSHEPLGTIVSVEHDPKQIVAPVTCTVQWDDDVPEQPGLTANDLKPAQ